VYLDDVVPGEPQNLQPLEVPKDALRHRGEGITRKVEALQRQAQTLKFIPFEVGNPVVYVGGNNLIYDMFQVISRCLIAVGIWRNSTTTTT
jgi:hypothetical protein